MPNTYTNLLYHIVFATRKRTPSIAPEWEDRLYEYLGGIVRRANGVLLAGGGMPDHAHLLARFGPAESLSDLLRLIKTNSSKWVHDTFPAAAGFNWQVGYSAFTVSQSSADTVRDYIRRQKEHHRELSFRDELLELLRRHQVDYDERYVFDD